MVTTKGRDWRRTAADLLLISTRGSHDRHPNLAAPRSASAVLLLRAYDQIERGKGPKCMCLVVLPCCFQLLTCCARHPNSSRTNSTYEDKEHRVPLRVWIPVPFCASFCGQAMPIQPSTESGRIGFSVRSSAWARVHKQSWQECIESDER